MLLSRLMLLGFVLIAVVALEPEAQNMCPHLEECPYDSQQCQEDEDCNSDSLCCFTPCGKMCTKQLHTGCELLRRATSRRAKSLGLNVKNVRMPRCHVSGSFEQIQCDNEIVNSCWCVDEQGLELAGTRASAEKLVNCTNPNPCAAHTCRMFCPLGFALDVDGCPLCKCRDPCDDVQCPSSLDCQVEEINCLDPPCPPIPICKRGRSLNNICPVGDPLRISDTIRPFLCGNEPSKPNCPPLYQCLVQPGNDYGVCCPASLKLQKTGDCPIAIHEDFECGNLCTHDLECPSIQKCCSTERCKSSCMHPHNVTECYHQKMLSEILSVNERMGRGYIPQCSSTGQFESKQCSRNGLVCWCVNKLGIKIKGSMGPAKEVNCSLNDAHDLIRGRSSNPERDCEKLECAAICEYGFQVDENECSTCKCDDPCKGYICTETEECIAVREPSCANSFCSTMPMCRPKIVFTNPCDVGTPLIDEVSGIPIKCNLKSENTGCPYNYKCTTVDDVSKNVCCLTSNRNLTEEDNISDIQDDKSLTMCQYLHNFMETMEGTQEDMTIALPAPSCDEEGNYTPMQCKKNECWCVDNFGTEIFNTRSVKNATQDCDKLKKSIDCLDLTCRMGCDYGFVLEQDTNCPSCQCRDPCSSITCKENEKCQMVEVSCTDRYCPPVPACISIKSGQCPYLIPEKNTFCEYECNSDLICSGTKRCCSNGCGTQCIEPLLLTGCQHQRAVFIHQAHETGMPEGRVYIPECKEDGSYKARQCDYGKKECWCVDFRGFEVSQSRLSNLSIDCELQEIASNCPLYKCIKDCEHGFELDNKGCRTCNCKNPCSGVNCRGEGESCRLVEVDCIDKPCPSVPICLPKKDNPCQHGEPLKIGKELVNCGPEYSICPSSHKCQLSPLGEYAICCPKPRDVCFESVNSGSCETNPVKNLTRFYFNPKMNKCQKFMYSGCYGNHNNFLTEEHCNLVCPVLSQCERLREKNQKASERYKKPTFIPRCEVNTGKWLPIQCLEHVGVCWCVNPVGEAIKGTLIRGNTTDCNFRQARSRSKNRIVENDIDLILEQLVMQLTSLDYTDSPDIQKNSVPFNSRCEILKSQCDKNGKFLATQCENELCWCVDEAGNQVPYSNTFKKGEKQCPFMPIESIDVSLGFKGEFDEISAMPVLKEIRKVIENVKGIIENDELKTIPSAEVLNINLKLVGPNKVDVAFLLENMVKEKLFSSKIPDITKSKFTHQLINEQFKAERVVSLEQREIISQSPVSAIAPYHTALIVVTAASAFIICILTLLVILYKRKIYSNGDNKMVENHSGFISTNRPIYIELPNDNLNSLQNLQAEKIKNYRE